MLSLFGQFVKFMRVYNKFWMAPIILGLVLGPLMERNVRRALLLSDGAWSVLFSSPIAITFWVLTLVSVATPAFLWLWRRRREPGDCATATDGGV